jgi:LuxR family maltose regulon positive regulatory protein
MLTDAERAVHDLDERDDWRPTASMLVGVALMLLGEDERADEAFEEGERLAGARGFIETRLIALSERSLLAGGRGHASAAEEFVLAAGHSGSGETGDGFPSAALQLAVSARVLLRQGRWDDARGNLAKAQRLTPRLTHALPWLAVQTRLELGWAYVTLRDVAAARSLVGEIEEILERRPELGALGDKASALAAEVDAMPPLHSGKATGLTGAELRLLPLLATHLSFREIGQRLYVSRNTIKTQAISVYRRLGVSTRSEAVNRAAELGLIEPATAGDL